MEKPIKKSIKEKKEEYRNSNQDYFEAILQLRNFNEKQFNEVIDYIEKKDCKIAKHIVQKEGVDLYLESQRFIQNLARWIKGRYNCQLKSTRKLHTRDSKANRDLYRVTVFVQFLKIKIGDIIDYNGEKMKISSLGKKPSGKIISSGKRIFIDFKLLP